VIIKQLNKFARLSGQKKSLLLLSIYYLSLFRIRLITTSPKTLFTIVSRRAFPASSVGASWIHPEEITRSIAVASRLVPFSTCLSEALAGFILFARYGYKTELHIGVSKDNMQQLEAHAWLSLHGRIILGDLPDLGRFKEFPLPFLKDP
jgi:hypothetical protein